MTAFSLDNSGEARLAIQEIYRDYGPAGIDDEALVNRLLPDLLPDSPREASLLRSAAGARVGRLLADRVAAQMPIDAAVRDVTAILVERLAFDRTACLWVVSEFARAMGHAVDIQPDEPPRDSVGAAAAGIPPQGGTPPQAGGTPPQGGGMPPQAGGMPPQGGVPPRPGDIEPTHMDPRYAPGRAGLVMPTTDDISGAFRYPPPRKSNAPLVVGIIAGVVVLGVIATIAIALALGTKTDCKTATCTTRPSSSPLHPSTQPPSPSSTPSIVPNNGVPALADVMPNDIVASEDCDSDGTPFLDHLSTYYACTESAGSTMAGMAVWGYQFATKADYLAGVAQYNTKVVFSPTHAGDACPPASSDGYVTWHRNDNKSVTLGHLECYYTGSHKNKDYAWTDDTEYTIIVAEATANQTFAQLDAWWTHNNNNSPDA